MPNSRFNTMISQHCANFRSLFIDVSQRLFEKEEDETRLFHPGEFGTHRELVSSTFLRPFTPDRFDIADGFILGPGNSDPAQCDILVIERDLAPFCQYRELGQFYPIEAIGAVGEVKSQLSESQFIKVLDQVSRQTSELRNRLSSKGRDAATSVGKDEIWSDGYDAASAPLPMALAQSASHLPWIFLICRRFSVAESAGTLPLWTKVRRQISASVEASPGVTIPNAILSLTDGLLIRRFYCGKDEYQCISPGKDSTTHLKKFLSIYFSHLARWSSQRVSFQSYFQVSEQDIVYDNDELSDD